jgi:predicted ATPase
VQTLDKQQAEESQQQPEGILLEILTHITIKGFKSLRLVDNLELGPINLLVGANGSGKSNFLEVFSLLHNVREGQLEDYVGRKGGAERLLHFGSKETKQIELELTFREGRSRYEITLLGTDDDTLFPSVEWVRYLDKPPGKPGDRDRLQRIGREAGISRTSAPWIAPYVKSYLSEFLTYHFHDTGASSPMKKPCPLHDNTNLKPDGSNLAAFLYYLKEAEPNEYEIIRRTIHQVAPFFQDFILKPMRLSPENIKLEWKHVGSDALFDSSSLSDGTLRFMALATLFLQPDQFSPSLLLVDEPELGLHPYAIEVLASLIHQASKSRQVIVSTQSPLLLDHFEPNQIIVADRDQGSTNLRRLVNEEFEEWLQDYSLGQLWEKNHLGGRPAIEVRRV